MPSGAGGLELELDFNLDDILPPRGLLYGFLTDISS